MNTSKRLVISILNDYYHVMYKYLVIFPLLIFVNCSKITPVASVPIPIKKEARSPKVAAPSQQVEIKKERFSLKNLPRHYPSAQLQKYCKTIDKKFHKYGWGKSYCNRIDWQHVRNSSQGRPLIWARYGDEKEHRKNRKNSTVIFCGVHGDEITPIKFCFDIIYYLEEHREEFANQIIAVAPVVSPDSFFKKYPTRTNANGVDINRNFPTKDWWQKALKLWRNRYHSDKRRYPGKRPMSEPAVLFQVNLIKRYMPNKIISVHAPLTMLDYDGPGDDGNFFSDKGLVANQLLIQMSNKARSYRIKNYPYFPGSLGNWAGKERSIPTYTLELPTSDNRQHRKYWNLFKEAIHSALLRDLRLNELALKKTKSP